MSRRGASLAMVLLLLLLVEGFAIVAATATIDRVRLSGSDRDAVESWLMAASALARARVDWQGQLPAMADGARLAGDWLAGDVGWRSRVEASRQGALVRIVAWVERRDPGNRLLASRQVTLLLEREPSDTVRVLAHRARM